MDNEIMDFEEFEDEANIIILTDENGEEVEFEYIGDIDYKERTFAVLLPTDENDDGLVILEVIEEEDSEMIDFVSVDDENLLEEVFEAFKEANKDLFEEQ